MPVPLDAPRISWLEVARDGWALQRDPFAVLRRWHQRHGDAFWLPGRKPRLALAAPEDVRHVLASRQDNYKKAGNFALLRDVLGEAILTSNGPRHDRERRRWFPHFQKSALKNVAARSGDHFRSVAGEWPSVGTVDLSRAFARVAVAVVGDVLLGEDLRADADIVYKAGYDIQSYAGAGVFTPWPGLARWPRVRSFRSGRRAVGAVADRVMARWAAGNPPAGLAAAIQKAPLEEPLLDFDRCRRDELVTLLLAGHETTANALAWTVSLVLRHPNARDRIQAEARAASGPDEDSFARSCFLEGLRLYPPAWCIGREALSDDRLPSGAFVPAGGHAVIFTAHCHRRSSVFPNPDQFIPDRFGAGQAMPPPDVYFPFGVGPRSCLGEGFALAEATAVLRELFRLYDLTSAGGVPKPEPLVTLRPRGGVWANVRRRVSGDS